MALKRENENLKANQGYSIDELMTLFVTLREEARIATLRRLAGAERQRRSRGEVLPGDKAPLLPSLSEQDTAMSTLPPVRSKVEFELMVRHPNAYSLFFPQAPTGTQRYIVHIPCRRLRMFQIILIVRH